jgi:hypothetical protein
MMGLNHPVNPGFGLTAKSAEFARRPAPRRPLLSAAAPATLSIDHATPHPSTASHLPAGSAHCCPTGSRPFGVTMAQLLEDGLVVQNGLAIIPRVYTTYQTSAAPKTQAPSSELTAHQDGHEI